MKDFWRSFFGFACDDNPNETYAEAVERAARYLEEENYEDAVRILRYAEKQNHAEAMYLLAWCYWRGTGVREDAAHALHLWRHAAQLGHQPSQTILDEREQARREVEEKE